MLMTIAADDPEAQPRFAAFRQELRSDWALPTAATSASIPAGSPAMRPTLAKTWRK